MFLILLLQPFDILPIGSILFLFLPHHLFQLIPAAAFVQHPIESVEIAVQQGQAPAVQDDMVIIPNQFVTALASSKVLNPQQRILLQVKSAFDMAFRYRGDSFRLLRLLKSRQIRSFIPDFPVMQQHLSRLGEVFVHNRRPQYIMPQGKQLQGLLNIGFFNIASDRK
ncbi:hypothetical protein D3C75_690600 [compost metagenome]